MTDLQFNTIENPLRSQELNQSQSMIDQCLPDYLFTDERNAQNILDMENMSAANNTAMIDQIDNDVKFSCSTPIKCYVEDNEELNETSSPKSNPTDLNRSDNSSSESEFNQNDCEIAKKEMFNSFNNSKSKNVSIKLRDEEFYNFSLLEFEENEKKANISKISSPDSFKSSLKAPINQMENLLNNLRNNYNYKNNLSEQSSTQANNQLMRSSMEQRASCEINLNVNKIKSQNEHEYLENKLNQNDKQQQSYFRKSDQLIALESRLEHEILRRQHCEKQIQSLNENLLELQQQLAVATGLDKKRESFAQNMDASIQKVAHQKLKNFMF